MVINEQPMCRIGVFEIESSQYLNILDKEGDVDLTKGNILFFSFAENVITVTMTLWAWVGRAEGSGEGTFVGVQLGKLVGR
jgi:hypothetical protein